jgi:hypothetical protein
VNFDLSLKQTELEPGAVLALDLVSEGTLLVEDVAKPILLAIEETNPTLMSLLDNVIGGLDPHLGQGIGGEHLGISLLDQVHTDDALVFMDVITNI